MRYLFYKYLNRIKNRHIVPVTVKLFPTWKCQLDCSYCSRHFAGENYAHDNEVQITPQKWVNKIVNFPIPIDTVVITGGGEPALYYGISEMIYDLIKRKYCVKLFTNLLKRIDLPKSGRLIISTTLHESANQTLQWSNIRYYQRQGIKVEIYKFDKSLESDFIWKPGRIGRKALIRHNTKGFDYCLHYPVFNFSPDGQLFIDQESMFLHYKNHGYEPS